ncbi:MAG: DegT/DnrJ/EryC1/StrS family aminotransferase [Gemmatimonadetes bacterium]|nr:DegT/DnrJ/EryC1/StrS family aminotransferase [Gemmatimonadota bacterium]
MNVPLLDLVAQYQAIKGDVLPLLMGVVERQQFILGEEVGRLEREIAALSHAKHAIACASGTDALLLALRTLDLAPGDQVICPAFTFFATAGTIHNAGGTPVFVDIEPGSFNLSPAAVEAAITPRTRAIIVVHLFGQMADMDALLALAARHRLTLIEDAAQAIGARRQVGGAWRMAGELGAIGAFSFFPSKNLGCWGDGGMMVAQDDAVAARLRRLRTHGGAKQYHHDEVGYNSRLDTLQAAVLLGKLPHLAGWSAARRARAARYTEAFAGLAAICPPRTDPANEHIFHQYTVRAERRDQLVEHLKAQGIGCAVYYPLALHLQPCFAHLGFGRGSLPVTEAAMGSVVSLPIYPELSDAQQDAVVAAVTGFYR